MVLAETLRTKIASGHYPIGHLLPTEHTLCNVYEVSRHTVREALRMLSSAGLISRRRGSGTLVMAKDTKQHLNLEFFGVDAVMNYNYEAKLIVFESETRPIWSSEARELNVHTQEDFMHVHGIRGVPGKAPLSITDMYIREDLCPTLDIWTELNGAVIEWIARERMTPTDRLDQVISATELSQEAAVKLSARASTPALKIIRRYFDQSGRIIGVSKSVHPADRFSYAMTIEKKERQTSS